MAITPDTCFSVLFMFTVMFRHMSLVEGMLKSGTAAAKREAAKMQAARLKRANSVDHNLDVPSDTIPEFDYAKLVKRIQELELLVLNLREENRALKEARAGAADGGGGGGGGGAGDDDDDDDDAAAVGGLPGQCSG